MITIIDAIHSLRPEAQWSLNGGKYEGLDWFDTNTQPKPTNEEVEAEIARLQAEYDLTEYQRQRAPEYPSIGDQLDALFHAGVFPPEMAAQIQAIKDKYPKPE